MKGLFPKNRHCVSCLTNLALDAASMASGEKARSVHRLASQAALLLDEGDEEDFSPPEKANRILDFISKETGCRDPYKDFKRREMTAARKKAAELLPAIRKELRPLLALAAYGNSMDFFNQRNGPESVLENDLSAIKGFSPDNIGLLEIFLRSRKGLLVYLTDNSGEIFFDLPLIEYLRTRFSEVKLVVKGGPGANDLTREELQEYKGEVPWLHPEDTGTSGVGIDWGRVSGRFLELLDGADLIFSKGMANFETIMPRRLKAPVFFLLKVKCAPVSDYLGTPVGSYAAVWKEGSKALNQEGPDGH